MCRKRRQTYASASTRRRIVEHFFPTIVDRNPPAGQQALKIELREGAQPSRLPRRQSLELEESEREFPNQLSLRQPGAFKNAVW